MKKIVFVLITLILATACELPQPCYWHGIVIESGTGTRLSDVKLSFDGSEYFTNSQGVIKIELTKTYDSEPYTLEKVGYRNIRGTISSHSLDHDMQSSWEMSPE